MVVVSRRLCRDIFLPDQREQIFRLAHAVGSSQTAAADKCHDCAGCTHVFRPPSLPCVIRSGLAVTDSQTPFGNVAFRRTV